MRPVPLTVINAGIDRLRTKGGARADSLYDLLNAYVTEAHTVVSRPGTVRELLLPESTRGLVGFAGKLHTFAASLPLVVIDSVDVTVGANEFSGTLGVRGWSTTVVSPPFGSASKTTLSGVTITDVLNLWQNNVPFNAIFGIGFETLVEAQAFLTAHAAYVLRVETAAGVVDLDFGDAIATDSSNDRFTGVQWQTGQNDEPVANTWTTADDAGEVRTVSIIGPFQGSDDFELHLLLHPTDPSAELEEIHFAEPYLGALYIVAEFDDGAVYHYWLQDAPEWEAETELRANEFRKPTTPNGYVYRATRLNEAYPVWAPGVLRTVGNGSSVEPSRIEPTEYNEFYYQAVDVEGDSPRSAAVEPVWPTSTGERIVENSDDTEAAANTSVAPPAPPEPNQPQQNTINRYTQR